MSAQFYTFAEYNKLIKIMEKGQFDTRPKGIDGLLVLVQSKPEFRRSLVDFIDAIPVLRYLIADSYVDKPP